MAGRDPKERADFNEAASSTELSAAPRVDGFEFERRLGAGGMGTVYLYRSKLADRQFAVKTILGRHLADPLRCRAFLAELEAWIDLPPHPNLVRCYFFRTLNDRIGLFLEYMDAPSLARWVTKRELTRHEPLLDVAIQTSWALEAVHGLGMAHQDVKPANILVAEDGSVKLTDFGLARARVFVDVEAGPADRKDALLSRGGMTLAYRSVEQAARHALSTKTDIWSFGLSILHMYAGEVTWLDGSFAPDILEDYLSREGDDGRPRMPPGVVRVLERCFRVDPDERWSSMAEVAEALTGVYRDLAGQPYPRLRPE